MPWSPERAEPDGEEGRRSVAPEQALGVRVPVQDVQVDTGRVPGQLAKERDRLGKELPVGHG